MNQGNDSVLVIGGGIAGIQASLDLAKAGAKVILVEKSPTIGGKMAVLDKNFPTLDCSICIEGPKMGEVGQNKNIEIFSPAQVVGLEGKPGDFKVTIKQSSRMVTKECTRCDLCAVACPVVVPNESDSSMAYRKAIYTPIAQAVPGPYLIDLKHCLNKPPHFLPCQKCVDACLPRCIDFGMPQETTHTRNIASVIVSVGYDMIDPEILKEYGYGTHPDILHSLELERLLISAGPTGGEVVKPSNGHHPKNVLLVLCVGSRDQRHYKYCSRFCCMYSVKHAFQLIDHGVKDVTVLYMDARAFGKGFDEFWKRTAQEGAKFVRGRPASISANPDNSIKVVYENTKTGKMITQNFDLVSLSHAVRPPESLIRLSKALGIELDADGFLQAVEEKGGLVHTTRPGVYAAGCASGPKDIPDSVAEGGAGAALSLGHLTARSWPKEEKAEPIEGIETPRIGVFVCHCGSNIAGVVDVKAVADFAKTLPGVVHTQTQMFSCAGNTQTEIENIIKEKQITRVVIAACSPKTHEETFRGACMRAGLNPYLLVMSNIRNMDSWVHKEFKAEATQKAKDMIRMAVEHARLLIPLHPTHQPVTQKALVIGGGVGGMTAAIAIARQGYETHLVEKTAELGGLVRHLTELAPAGIKAQDLLASQKRQLNDLGVKVHLNTTIEQISGFVGNFQARLSSGEELKIGAVVLAMGADPYKPVEFGYGQRNGQVITNLELESLIKEGKLTGDKITFVGCVGSRNDKLGCSRYCCASMISQALHLRRMGKKVRIIYKDVRCYTRHAEELYEQAAREGVQFFQYNLFQRPEEAVKFENGLVTFKDELTGSQVQIPTDHLVMAVGLKPVEETISSQLKLPKSLDGFLLELHPKLGPAETATQGIYLAGCVQYPKDVRETVAQALAAASKASALLAKDAIEKEPLIAKINQEKCTLCWACAKVCPFGAIETTGKPGKGKGAIRVIEAACMGCGNCAAQCNFGAIEMPYFTREGIMAQIDAALKEKPEEKVMVFTCNWCSYAGADQAGIEKIQYPPSSRIIRTMCSARFEQGFVARCFEKGAGAVVISGCRLTDDGSDCHYNYANVHTFKRFKAWQQVFAKKGIAEERLQLRWISAAEGKEFAHKMHEMHAIVMKNAEHLRKEREAKEKTPSAVG
ncbi:MAG: FAD-dependent oxidoreductase [Elusimicrobia bacterium]|nr:FAD-dependent oxidoreductase [Elusimicrobiota bacterium]